MEKLTWKCSCSLACLTQTWSPAKGHWDNPRDRWFGRFASSGRVLTRKEKTYCGGKFLERMQEVGARFYIILESKDQAQRHR
jgi:hypothetical protein